jgi:hypothetical protein
MAALAPAALSSIASSAQFTGSVKVNVAAKANVRPAQISVRRSVVVKATDKKDVEDTVGERIAAGVRDIAGKVEDIATGRGTDPVKGESRAVSNANTRSDATDQVKKAGQDAAEAVKGAVNSVTNALGNNEGYDASTQKGAYTTPQREALKGRYDPAKNSDRPPQKTVDIQNPFDKK